MISSLHVKRATTKRLKRCEDRLEEAQRIHQESIERGTCAVHADEGKQIEALCQGEIAEMWRLKVHVRKIRDDVQSGGFWETKLPWYKGKDMKKLKTRVKRYFSRAVTTSVFVEEISAKYSQKFEDGSSSVVTTLDDLTFYSTLAALVDIDEETEDGVESFLKG